MGLSKRPAAIKHEYRFPGGTIRSYADGSVREFFDGAPRSGKPRSRLQVALALMALRASRRGQLEQFFASLQQSQVAAVIDALCPCGRT